MRLLFVFKKLAYFLLLLLFVCVPDSLADSPYEGLSCAQMESEAFSLHLTCRQYLEATFDLCHSFIQGCPHSSRGEYSYLLERAGCTVLAQPLLETESGVEIDPGEMGPADDDEMLCALAAEALENLILLQQGNTNRMRDLWYEYSPECSGNRGDIALISIYNPCELESAPVIVESSRYPAPPVQDEDIELTPAPPADEPAPSPAPPADAPAPLPDPLPPGVVAPPADPLMNF